MFRSVRSKFKPGSKEHVKEACSTAISGLKTTLRIVKEAAGAAGGPGLQAGIGCLLFVLDAIKKTSQNADDIEKLSNQIEELNQVLENLKNAGTLSSVVIDRIDRVFSPSNTALEELRRMASRPAIKRYIHHEDDTQSISSHIQTVTWSIQSFTVETMLTVEFALDEHAVRIQGKIDTLDKTTTSGFQQVNARLDMKDEHPPYAIFSPFDCKDRTRCMEGTRTDILDQIFRWIGLGKSHSHNGLERESGDATADTRIFWVNGSAGTGKTTIAYTIAEACRTLNILGASFFCSRDDADCSNPRMVFTSIAYQLGNFSALFKAEVARVMRSKPDIGYANPSYQLEELIVKPLRLLGKAFSPCVVVLDALDECKEAGGTSAILSSLSLHISQLVPLKFLVTSRPESHITEVFKSSDLNPVTWRYILHEVQLDVVQSDIEHYLSSKLALTRERYHLEKEWPSTVDIHALALLSSGLFIFASTSIRFIEDRNYCDPRHQLARLLSNVPTVTESSSPHGGLDQLYAQVLNHAFPDISSHLSGRLKTILGTVVLLREPLSPVALERLLRVKSSTARETLLHLHSIVMVPDDDTQVIRTLHPSFFDFITSPTRCQNSKFVVNPQAQHTLLAQCCLEAMRELKRDICGIRNPSMLNSEVVDLPLRITTCVPPQLQYACRHWAWHLANARFSDSLLDLVKEFCLKHLLYWVEVLSLLGDLRNALLALSAMQQAMAKTGRDMTDSIQLLHDCERFTREFFSIISTSSLQIYHSALLFTPWEVQMKKIYGGELDLPLKMYNALDRTWNPCIRTMEGHSGSVHSIVFSPDGTRIVSGSGDNTLRLWDVLSGAHVNTFEGHSSGVFSVAFSPDGARIVSGSDDHTLRLWDAVSGAHLNTLEGHSDLVLSVTFSPDGTRIVSGSADNTLQLWDAVDGLHLRTFEGYYSTAINSVAFFPDGRRIVSGSDDRTVRLWHVASGTLVKTLRGHSSQVLSVAISPDGTRIVSGSDDCTLQLWDPTSGQHLKTLEGHSSSVYSVAFSSDGTRIASGSDDWTLRLWDVVSASLLNTFHGHSSWVLSVTFSFDGKHIVSGSYDRSLRLWDAIDGAHLNTDRNSTLVNSIAFSPDGTRIVTGSNDQALQLWDAVSRARLNTLQGHTDRVNSVIFSGDGKRIVSGSHDKTLRLWDAVSGVHLNSLEGHSSSVYSVAFSPDDTRIVSGSHDKTLRQWDAVSGAHLITLEGHSFSVHSVAFSPDGTRIASGSYDGTLRLWNAVNGAHLKTLTGHMDGVHSLAFSPDGIHIVSGSDNTLLLWNAVSGAQLDTLQGHFSGVRSLAQSCGLLSPNSFIDRSNPTGPIFGYIGQDGWVYSIAWNRRICWIPVSCRPRALAMHGDRVFIGTGDGRAVFLDFTGIGFYFRNL